MNRADLLSHPPKVYVRVWVLSAMAFWGVGCGNPPGPSPSGPSTTAGAPTPLRIALASDLQAAWPRLEEGFRTRSGIPATATILSSGVLAQQIKHGAPYDVFMAANQAFVRDLADGGSIRPESVHAYGRGSLVLAVHGELGQRIRSLADLASPEVKKIALANPIAAPYGRAGKQALERAGLWERLQPRIVLAESVRQALHYVQKGDAEAGLVGRAIANVPEVRSIEIDPALYDPIVQALGIVADSKRHADAEEFARFVLGEDGQAILKEFGFRPAPDPEIPPMESRPLEKPKGERER